MTTAEILKELKDIHNSRTFGFELKDDYTVWTVGKETPEHKIFWELYEYMRQCFSAGVKASDNGLEDARRLLNEGKKLEALDIIRGFKVREPADDELEQRLHASLEQSIKDQFVHETVNIHAEVNYADYKSILQFLASHRGVRAAGLVEKGGAND